MNSTRFPDFEYTGEDHEPYSATASSPSISLIDEAHDKTRFSEHILELLQNNQGLWDSE